MRRKTLLHALYGIQAVDQIGTPTSRAYRQYTGTEGVYTHTFEYEKRPECPVCGGEVKEVTAPGDQTLEEFIEELKLRPDVWVHHGRLFWTGTVNL